MADQSQPEKLRIGFITAIEPNDGGFVAGLLVTNHFGRPLEFQCTMPVRPNRTQELLYGPTLVPFVLGELIGKTLVEKTSVKPHLFVTDRPEMVELRAHVGVPVVCLADGKLPLTAQEREISLGDRKLRIHSEHAGDESIIEKRAADLLRRAEIVEPLERIREALNETMNTGAAR